MTRGTEHSRPQLRLGVFFLRAAPVRTAGVIGAVTAFVLLVALLTLQSLQLSGEQEADSYVGAAGYSLNTSTAVKLGTSGAEVDDALRAAVIAGGGDAPTIRYSVLDPLTLSGDVSGEANYEEAAWQDNPFPTRFAVEAGQWPTHPAEVAVTTALAEAFPVGSLIELFDGAWQAQVVGVVHDDFARSASTLFAAEGTWNSLASISSETASRFGVAASRTLSWDGGDPAVVAEGAAAAVATLDGAQPDELLLQQVQSREEIVSRGSATLIEFRLASLVAPFLAAMVGVLIATRFINRIREVMHSIGIAQNKTRASAVLSIALSLTLGLLVGVGLGIAAGFALRPLLNATSDRALGPIQGIGGMIFGLLIATIAGGALGLFLNAVRQKIGVRERRADARFPARYVVLGVLSIALLAGGYVLAQSARSTDEIILAGICLAAAGVALLPLVLEVVVRREPTRLPALLAVRRLRADSKRTGWITASVAGLMVIGFATTTLLTSAMTTMNESNAVSVQPGQIHLTVPEGASNPLVAEVTNHLSLQPVTFFTLDAGVTLLDGATLVVENTDDFEALTGVQLTDAERDLLVAGGTVRTKTPEITEVTLEASNGGVHVISALTNEKLAADYRSYDGFVLRAFAEANAIALVAETQAFLNPTPEQITLAEGAALELGFNADWLALNKTASVFGEPLEARIVAIVISLLAVAVLIFFVFATTQLLRPNLSTLRAAGAGRWWLTEVLVRETSLVVIVSVVGASVVSVAGMFTAITVAAIDLKLVVPWQSIGITIAVLMLGAAAAMFVSSRRLTNDDRFTNT